MSVVAIVTPKVSIHNHMDLVLPKVSIDWHHHLSDREKEILKLLVDGLDYRDIAEKIFVSRHTVRNHISNIYTKLHVSSKALAIKMATKNNLV